MVLQSESLEPHIQRLIDYVEKEAYKGYDPYDTLNSKLPLRKLGKWPPILAIQIQKRNPLNTRALFGVKKGHNPKGMGLFLHAYSHLHAVGDKDYRPQMDQLFNWLGAHTSPGWKQPCWGYNFDWASPAKYLEAYSPTIVVTGFIAKAIWAYYDVTKAAAAREMLIGIGDFMLNELPRTEDDTGWCFSYSTTERDICYNASMLGAEHFARLFAETKEDKYKEIALKTAGFVAARQHEDGRWNYSQNPSTGVEREQIDFHQGYVLDSLATVAQYAETKQYDDHIRRGVTFYFQNQFDPEGRAYWRIPKKWPADIHNQAQGILTGVRLRAYYPEGPDQANLIAGWTLKHMLHRKGYFIYKKYPSHKIRTPFIRWSQAWMLLAMAELHRYQRETDG